MNIRYLQLILTSHIIQRSGNNLICTNRAMEALLCCHNTINVKFQNALINTADLFITLHRINGLLLHFSNATQHNRNCIYYINIINYTIEIVSIVIWHIMYSSLEAGYMIKALLKNYVIIKTDYVSNNYYFKLCVHYQY